MKNKFLRLGIFGLLTSVILGFAPTHALANCHTRFLRAALKARFAKSGPVDWSKQVLEAHQVGRRLLNQYRSELAAKFREPPSEPTVILPWDIVTGVTSADPNGRALMEEHLGMAQEIYSDKPNRYPSRGFVFGLEGEAQVLDFISRLKKSVEMTDLLAVLATPSFAAGTIMSLATCTIFAEPFEVVREACTSMGLAAKNVLMGVTAMSSIVSFTTWVAAELQSQRAHQQIGLRALVQDVRWNLATPEARQEMEPDLKAKKANGPHELQPGEVLWISMQTRPQGLEIGFRIDERTGVPSLLMVYWPATPNVFNFAPNPLALIPGTFTDHR